MTSTGQRDPGLQDHGRPGVRPDASMTLLREVMERPLDPGYAHASRQRRQGVPRPAAWLTVVLAAALACVTVWGVGFLRAPQPGAVAARTALERQIAEGTARARALQEGNAELRVEISRAQADQLELQGGSVLVDRAGILGLASGELPVVGPGLEVSVEDAPTSGDSGVGSDPRQEAEIDEGRVLDRDLQVVVNGLWAAGAEAISINGQRLTALSAIRSAGQAILVDFRPLVPPYVVLAVGDPAQLQAGFAADVAGPYVQSLRDNYGIPVSVAARDSVEVPGAGQLSLRWARPAQPEAASGAPPPSPGAGLPEVSP